MRMRASETKATQTQASAPHHSFSCPLTHRIYIILSEVVWERQLVGAYLSQGKEGQVRASCIHHTIVQGISAMLSVAVKSAVAAPAVARMAAVAQQRVCVTFARRPCV